jgi:hypothetical protein
MKIVAYEWAVRSSTSHKMHLRRMDSNNPACGKSSVVRFSVTSFSGDELNRIGKIPACPECQQLFDSP